MIYGRDEAVVYPVADLYDTGMMNAYISAVKDEYERGLKAQDEFVSKYGDFMSPFSKDVDTWNQLTMDRVEKAYNDLEKIGVDPIRSQEGRQYLYKVIRSVPRETLSKLKQSAKAGEEYLQNRSKLQSQGRWNPEFENFLLGGKSFQDWSTVDSGMWDRTSPMEYKDLKELTSPWMAGIDSEFDEELTKKKNDGFDYYTTSEKKIRGAINDNINEFLLNDYGKFFYNKALNDARSTALPGETEDSIRQRANKLLEDSIYSRNSVLTRKKREVNPYYMERIKYSHDIALENLRHKHDMDKLKWKANNSGTQKKPNTVNYNQSLLVRGALSLSGGQKAVNAYYGNPDMGFDFATTQTKNSFLGWKKKNMKLGRTFNLSGTAYNNYKNRFLNYTGQMTEDKKMLPARLGRKYNTVSSFNKGKVFYLYPSDLDDIESTDEFVVNSFGNVKPVKSGYVRKLRNRMAYDKYRDDKDELVEDEKYAPHVYAQPTGRVFTKVGTSGQIQQYSQIKTYDTDGKYIGEGYMKINEGAPSYNDPSGMMSIYPEGTKWTNKQSVMDYNVDVKTLGRRQVTKTQSTGED